MDSTTENYADKESFKAKLESTFQTISTSLRPQIRHGGPDRCHCWKSSKRYPLTFGPTPIEHLPRLTAALGGKVDIYAKRDDCNSGLAMGGKAQEARIYRARRDRLRRGYAGVDRWGPVESYRMVAATAAKIGMKCVVIQEKWVPHYDAVYDRVGNILMTKLMGADSRLVEDGFDSASARAGRMRFSR
ncbi:pyridoxal-phosphate dependent enzyme [Rhizobium leguminosarum]|uniref:pyridoxal-phosphate dependent enzyme n=1 Tax=Rhizobium leguminosarum TaxID=384 RepID=UPI002FEF45FE